MRNHYYLLLLGCVGLSSHDAYAFEWRIRPSLSMSEIFSDNLNLSDNAKKSGFVTEVAPGLSLYGQSPWSNFNLNYRLQGLYNAGGSDAVDVNHQLHMNSLYQAVRNTFFIQTSSSISQQNISNAFVATDNISGNRNRTEVKNFSISPYLTPHFGQYGSGLLKVGYDRMYFGNTSNSQGNLFGANPSLVSDSETFTKQASFSSGAYFGRLRWNLNYSDRDQNQANGNDVRFESYMAGARYFISSKYNVFAQAGEENNDYRSNNIKNGFFYTVGGQWSPSKWYSVEAGVGNNKHVSLRYSPSNNLNANITYRNKDVGLNRGNSWDAHIQYMASQASVGFNYTQDTTTIQDTLRQLGTGADFINDYRSLSGLPPLSLPPGFLLPYNFELTTLFDGVVVTKHSDLYFNYRTGKSFFNVTGFYQNNTYENTAKNELRLFDPVTGAPLPPLSFANANAREDTTYGVTGSWRWQFDPRLSFYLQPKFQTTDGIASNERYDVAMGLTRSIPINLGRPLQMNTKLELRHIEQTSNQKAFDYTENRATANFFVQF